MVLYISARTADRAVDEVEVIEFFGGCFSPIRSGTQVFPQIGEENSPDKGKGNGRIKE